VTLAIAACVKNEAPYIREWIEFHRLQGVGRFFITDNGSTDGTLEMLQEYEAKDIVTLKIDLTTPVQMKAYRYWLYTLNQREDSPQWVAFIDVDEFLFSPGGVKVVDVLRNYTNAGAVAVHWLLYGSKEESTSPGLVIDRFRYRAKGVNPHVKSIVNMKDFTANTGPNPHAFRTTGKVVDENGNHLNESYAVSEGGTADILRINHYHCKSKEEAKRRWAIPRADTGQLRDFEQSFKAHDTNEFYDPSAALYVPSIQKELRLRVLKDLSKEDYAD